LLKTFTGYRTFKVNAAIINELYKKKEIAIWDKRHTYYPNLYLILENESNEKHTALAKVSAECQSVSLVTEKNAFKIFPRNREQIFALDALLDPTVSVVALTGPAGTGKSILALAAALQQIEKKHYDKIILTRPMSEVGRYKLGSLPGDAAAKFEPYLLNYTTNLEQLVGGKHILESLSIHYKVETVPLQLIRGASFNRCLVLADEIQVCTPGEILTIGTRIGENSKLVLMGDLDQRDEKIAKDKTGVYKFINSPLAKQSAIVSTIELIKCERSETARLFAEVFKEEE
jgi:PhoH-like ATPase